MPVLEAAVEAIELEAWGDDIQNLIFKSNTLYNFFKSRVKVVPISNQTAAGGVSRGSFRVPFKVQAGASIAQTTGDASSMLRGTGSSFQDFAVSPVTLLSVCEMSWLAQRATQGKQRGLVTIQAEELKASLDQATQGIEAQMNSDGSGTIDQIPSTATINNGTGAAGPQYSSIAGLNVAAGFTDQQVVQVFSAVGGTLRGSFLVSFADGPSQTIFSTQALPAGTTQGDYLMIAGTSGAAGASVLGIRAWDVNSNVGTIGGIARANYPGRLSTPTINLGGGALTPGVANRAQALLARTLGPDNKGMESGVWYGGYDQALAVANQFYNVQITQNIEKSETVPDRARKYLPDTFGGREYIPSAVAQPGRIDLLVPEKWVMGEMVPLELYDFGGGNTIAPVPDVGTTNGTYLMSHMFAYVTSFNLVNAAPRAGLYIQGAAVQQI